MEHDNQIQIESGVVWWKWGYINDTCAICKIELELLPSNSKNSTLLKGSNCSHVYHASCIKQWLKHRSVCPLCNLAW